MFYPSFVEVKKYEKDYNIAPIAYEIYADTETPINLFLKFKESCDCCFLLESVNGGEKWGRYSFIGFNPKMEVTIKDYNINIFHRDKKNETIKAEPFEFIKTLLDDYKSPKIKNIPKLCGGLVGYFSYDSVRYVEKRLKNPPFDDLNMYDCHFMLCDEIIAFDHLKQKIIIIKNVSLNGDILQNYNNAIERCYHIEETLKKELVISKKTNKGNKNFKVSSNISKEQFIENVEKAKHHIKEGDIFQIVLSQRFEIENPPDSFDVYRVLRLTNPSPYMYYFKFKDYYISGASPEMLVSVDEKLVYTRPIAGTIKRGENEKQDRELEQMLLNDQKERAEHTMLVDLGRNDIGKVCEFGSVEVLDFMHIERYSQVMHLVTDVCGKLKDEKAPIDVLKAVLPAGTLSGAPKVRAMELIDEIENTKRGLYGGTVGYIAFDQNMDTCIAIRTILFKNNKAYIQAGAGIVADSVPSKEFEETENKAKAMVNAILEAGERV